MHNWLYYDVEKGGTFCKVCKKFLSNDQNATQRSQGIFIYTPFTHYRKATDKTSKLLKHLSSEIHAKVTTLNKIILQEKNKSILYLPPPPQKKKLLQYSLKPSSLK